MFGLQWLEHIKLNWQKYAACKDMYQECCINTQTFSGGNHCLDLCRERPTTEVCFQTKVSSIRTDEEGRGRTGQVGADECD